MIPIVVAAIACVALVLVSELARIATIRLLRETRGARIAGAFVGMIAAYLAIAALAFAFYRADGVPTGDLEVVVDSVPDGFPATGKIERNDRLVAIDGLPLTKSLSSMIDERNGAPVRLTVIRRGKTQDITLTPIGHDGHWMVGFRPRIDRARSHDIGLVSRRAITYPIDQTKRLIPEPAHEPTDPGGPKRLIEEYTFHRHVPVAIESLGTSLEFMTYVLLLIVLVDLVRVVRAVTAR